MEFKIIIPILIGTRKINDPLKSYRQIYMLASLSKLLERIIQYRIKLFIRIIPPHKFGFEPFYSTIDKSQQISKTKVDLFENKKITITAVNNLSQVWHQELLSKLKTLKCSTLIYKALL